MSRNLKLLWLADALSHLGTSLYTLVLTLLALQLSHHAFGAGLVLFVTTLPYLVLGVVGGAVVDRLNRKPLLSGCETARAALVLTLPPFHALGWLTDGMAMVAGFLMTGIRTVAYPAVQASVPLLASDTRQLNKANAYLEAARHVATVLGPAVGATMMDLGLAPVHLAYGAAAAYFASACCICLIRFPARVPRDGPPSLLSDAIGSLKWMFMKNKGMAILLGAFAVQLVVGKGMVHLGVPTRLDQLDPLRADQRFGFFLSLIALAAAFGSAVYAQLPVRRHARWVFAGYALRGLTFGVLAFAERFWTVALAGVVLGISYVLGGVPFITLLQTRVPANRIGQVLAVHSTLGNLCDGVSYLLVGGLVSLLPLSHAFLFLAMVSLGSAAIGAGLWRAMTQGERPPVRGISG